jgi:hypothetical protein
MNLLIFFIFYVKKSGNTEPFGGREFFDIKSFANTHLIQVYFYKIVIDITFLILPPENKQFLIIKCDPMSRSWTYIYPL